MARFWTADLHLGHEKVSALRWFPNTEKHDAEILEQLNMLDWRDHVWVLGDISSGKPADEERALGLLRDVKAHLHLIAGNHDSVSSIHRDGWKKQPEWLDVFDSIQQFGRIKLNGQQVLMSHYPYARSGDGPGRGDGRYLEYRLPDVGLPLIHGHTHHSDPHMPLLQRNRATWPAVKSAAPVLDTTQFCVSWDAHRGLVPEGNINAWLDDLMPKERTTQ